MNAFQICWIIAGGLLGYFTPELIKVIRPIMRIPVSMNLSFAFIGGLISYTLVK